VLPTVEQVHEARKQFLRWRVDARAQRRSPSTQGDDLRVWSAAGSESSRSQNFLPLRARKAVIEAGQVRDGP
jgi:hypothetical protein